MPSKTNDIPLMKVCSVWLYFDNADYSRIQLWSGIIGCGEKALKELIENVRYIASNKKIGKESDDVFLNVVYLQMKDLTTDGMKVVFQGMRNK